MDETLCYGTRLRVRPWVSRPRLRAETQTTDWQDAACQIGVDEKVLEELRADNAELQAKNRELTVNINGLRIAVSELQAFKNTVSAVLQAHDACSERAQRGLSPAQLEVHSPVHIAGATGEGGAGEPHIAGTKLCNSRAQGQYEGL